MKYPRIFNSQELNLTLPILNGGVNFLDSQCNIADNELADCNNMIFLNGALTTRPAITDPIKFLGSLNAKITNHFITFSYKNNCGTLISAKHKDGQKVQFFIVSENSVTELPQISLNTEDFLLTQHKNTLYLFLDGNIFTLSNNDNTWQDANGKIYIPSVAVDCKYSADFDGVFCEPFNLLANSYSLVYTTKNEAWHNALTDQVLHEMTYVNFFYEPNLSKYKGKTITATLTDTFGTQHTHSVVLSDTGFGKETTSTDGLYMLANINNITFFTDAEYTQIAYKYKSDLLLKNDLTITFPILEDKTRKDKVFKNNLSCWFGGGKGIYGGSRLFLAGNKNEPNRVIWSDLNNPLYFPENNFFCVGSSGSVTALKPQSDMLIIFTENEIYYTKYTEDTSVSADDIISGSVYDYFAKSVYFPLTQISAEVGCDCPNTLQLLNNRLTFANSNGKIYTLKSSNKFNEHNLYEIGELMHKKLMADTDLKTAVSIDYNGKYLLLSGQNLYVFCYANTEQTSSKYSWYFCTLPTQYYQNAVLAEHNNTLFIAGVSGDKTVFATFKENSASDQVITASGECEKLPILSMFKTKSFSFTGMFNAKNILSAELFLRSNSIQSLVVEYGSNDFIKSTQITPPANSFSGNKSIKLYPNFKNALHFSLKVLAHGNFSVDALKLKGGK